MKKFRVYTQEKWRSLQAEDWAVIDCVNGTRELRFYLEGEAVAVFSVWSMFYMVENKMRAVGGPIREGDIVEAFHPTGPIRIKVEAIYHHSCFNTPWVRGFDKKGKLHTFCITNVVKMEQHTSKREGERNDGFH